MKKGYVASLAIAAAIILIAGYFVRPKPRVKADSRCRPRPFQRAGGRCGRSPISSPNAQPRSPITLCTCLPPKPRA